MMLVVDSGSTKADWALVSENRKTGLHTSMGFNPYFHDQAKVQLELSKKEFTDAIPVAKIKYVFYYGAGCPDDFYRGKMSEALKSVFTNADVQVHHDLLGAARATCGHEPGIAGILGTGSNSCSYDGKNVTDNIPALAHVLGDEGGGVHLGRVTLQAYFYRELPPELHKDFNETYPEGPDAIIHRIYGEGQNVHIASFAQFLIKHRTHPFAKNLIHSVFREFGRRHVKKYKNWQTTKVNLVGSIADILSDELQVVFSEEQLQLGQIVRKPIDELVKYHLSERRL